MFTFIKCPYCGVWDYHKVVVLHGKNLQVQCKKCLRIFTQNGGTHAQKLR